LAHFKGYSLCKVLAVVLSVLIAGQAHFAISGRSQEETPGAKFEAARAAYLDGKYEGARDVLAGLAANTAETEENRTFLGGVYLLLAASEENLGQAEEARKHYAKAHELLGEKEASVAGVNFGGLGLYLEFFAPKVRKDQAAVLNERLAGAKNLFFSGDFEGAKAEAEKLAAEFASLEGFDVIKGETYLLLGAAHEKLKYKELAVKYYCRAKEILGANRTFAGLELKKLKYYKEECRAVAGRTAARRGGGFLGKALGTLLFLGALGGLVWYLFFSPNAPLKKKAETYEFTSSCFSTNWIFNVNATFTEPGGQIVVTPDSAPQPSQNNNWEDSVTYTLSTSGGGSLVSISLRLDVEVGGGDNGRRHDLAWVDDVLRLDQTNTFAQPCSSPGIVTYSNIYSRASTGSFTLRHKVELSRASGDKLDSANHAANVSIIKE
jgi:Flp pilus assembly protein TadD